MSEPTDRERIEDLYRKILGLTAEVALWAHERGWRGDDADPRLGSLDALRDLALALLDSCEANRRLVALALWRDCCAKCELCVSDLVAASEAP